MNADPKSLQWMAMVAYARGAGAVSFNEASHLAAACSAGPTSWEEFCCRVDVAVLNSDSSHG